ncbi:hypothetical protein ACFLUV_00615 [Elusimicrobiota bacterium]
MKSIDWEKIDIKKFAGIVSGQLKKNGIDAVLVGGACVTIYTKNEYMSYDLDYVSYSTVKEIKPCLEAIGFKKEGTKRFIKDECEFYIELVPPPVAVGREAPITKFKKINTSQGTITLLTPTDCVKDSLAAYYHWDDPQSLEQALLVAKKQNIDIKEIKLWSKKENKLKEFNKFRKLLNEQKNSLH